MEGQAEGHDCLDSPTKKQAEERLAEVIEQGFDAEEPVLVEALPAMGKSRGVIKWAARTGNPLTVLTARHELYDQYTDWCEEFGLTARQLPTFHNGCETANGTHGDDWMKRVRDTYADTELSAGELHKYSDDLFGEQLPCQQGDGCSYLSTRDFDPGDYDVLIGHYLHANVPDRIDDRYIAFDEFPEGDFLSEYSAETVAQAVQEYLGEKEGLPFDYLKDLKEYRHDPGKRQEGKEWFEKHNPELVRDVAGTVQSASGNGHIKAPMMTYAILVADDLDNRWEYADVSDNRTAVIAPKDESLTVFTRPQLDDAASVVALDGTPTVEKWRLLLGDDLRHVSVLSDAEKQEYLSEVLGISIIQTTHAANHYSGRSTISVTPEHDLVLFEAVEDREKYQPAMITTQAAKDAYEQHGLSDVVQEAEHYGNLEGSNKYASTRVGIVAGSPHYGDEFIEKWAALAGESVSRVEGTKGMDQDFGQFGNQILKGMRENSVLQAAMRFGRDGDGAIVYVHTGALPDWVWVDNSTADIRRWPDGMNEVLDAIDNLGTSEWRTSKITERVTISDQQTRKHLKTLVKFGYISKRNEGRGYTWTDESLDEIGVHGHVQFGS